MRQTDQAESSEGPGGISHRLPKDPSIRFGSVFQMDDHIRNRVKIKLIGTFGQIQFPIGDHTCSLKWKVAFVIEIELKQPTVTDAFGDSDLLIGPPVGSQYAIIWFCCSLYAQEVLYCIDIRLQEGFVAHLTKSRLDGLIGANYGRDADREALDLPTKMSREVLGKESFGQRKLTTARFLQA